MRRLSPSKQVFRFIGYGFVLAFLTSCSTQKTVVKRPTQTTKTEQVVSTEQTAADFLEQAQGLPSAQAMPLLISASELFFKESNHAKSLWLAEQLLPLTDTDTQRYQLNVLKAQNLYLLSEYEMALAALNNASTIKATNKDEQYYKLLANIQNARGLALIAADANLRALHASTEVQDINALWQQLNGLSQWQIEQLVAMNPPHVKGWQQLLNFAHRFGYQTSSFHRYLAQWRRDFPNHPALAIVEQLQGVEQLRLNEYQNIAVILPLSGTHQKAGESAQQGILAGYNNNPNQSLHFIDSNQLDFSTLASQLDTLSIDYVIGPLLKANVDAYITQQELVKPTLLLNLPTKAKHKSEQIVFSMDPKNEAIQAATTLSRKQFQHPIVLSLPDNVSRRIANTFVQQWRKITGEQPEIIFFTDKNEIQDQLKDSLGIKQSQQRITNIDQRIRQKLKTQARNRRDLDMIYLVGSPNETRLLKPYIDVNISPFAQGIPIFASSRSHSDNADSSDSRDLVGLTFTEMPWLLNSKQQNASLKQLSKTIWPDKNDNLQRIFAMGYDSLSLIDKFEVLQQNAYIRHYGQTGVLQLTKDGILTRSLLWGSYQKDQVAEFAME